MAHHRLDPNNDQRHSLYLLKNFRDISTLIIRGNGKPIDYVSGRYDWRHGVPLHNLTEMHVNVNCGTSFDDLLSIAPNLETLHVYFNAKWSNRSTATRYDHTEKCLQLISTIAHKYMETIVGKYKNIKQFTIFAYDKNVCSKNCEYATKIEYQFADVIKLKSNSWHDILLHAYKIVCMQVISELFKNNVQGELGRDNAKDKLVMELLNMI